MFEKQVNWLLQDEIASAHRLGGVINASVLSMVENHVKKSQDKPKCISEEVPLQYVYGTAKSNALFLEVGWHFS